MLSNLRPGSGVAVVAPSGPVPPEPYRAGLEILSARYTLVHVFEPPEHRPPLPYLAAPDAERLADFNRALSDPRVDCIICARGGYGALRLLPSLDERSLVQRHPLLTGFSDATVLHAWASRLGVPTIHGPVVTQLPTLTSEDREGLFDLLEGRELPRLTGMASVVPGEARGPLRGGNLTVLGHLCGTPYFPDLRGAILLLEEVGEAPYRIDRMLTHLLLADVLDGVAGIVVGELTGCDAPQGHPPLHVEASRVVRERLAPLGVPMVMEAPIGHGARHRAVPLGTRAILDAGRGSLTFLPG